MQILCRRNKNPPRAYAISIAAVACRRGGRALGYLGQQNHSNGRRRARGRCHMAEIRRPVDASSSPISDLRPHTSSSLRVKDVTTGSTRRRPARRLLSLELCAALQWSLEVGSENGRGERNARAWARDGRMGFSAKLHGGFCKTTTIPNFRSFALK